MIGIAGIYKSQNLTDSIERIISVHTTKGIKLAALPFMDSHLSACVLMRDEIKAYEADICYYENEQYLFLLEGLISLDGPLYGIPKKKTGEKICSLWASSKSFLADLNGEYVFLLYNKKNSSLSIVNDHFGTRPFFYSQSHNTIRFGSEIKSILATGQKASLDHAGLLQFFCFSHNIGDYTIFNNIKALPPASIISFDGSQVKINKYWKLRFHKDKPKFNVAQTIKAATKALREGASRKLESRGVDFHNKKTKLKKKQLE